MLVANRFLSIDAGVRARLAGDSYRPRSRLGEVIDGFAVGVVIESRHSKFPVGARVSSANGWQTHYLSDGKGLLRLDDRIFSPPIPDSAAIGVLGVSGLTAYFGLRLGGPRPSETVLVSSAAGPVGATAGQIASIRGCQVVGIAGGDRRCAYVTAELGFAACIDRRTSEDLAGAIRHSCPGGVDVYLDNVGGEVLDAALLNMNRGGRVVLCGQVSEYNRVTPRGARNVNEIVERSLTMQGFVVWDFLSEFKAATAELAGWIRGGRLRWHEEVVEGFERAPQAFSDLFAGSFLGRCLIKLY